MLLILLWNSILLILIFNIYQKTLFRGSSNYAPCKKHLIQHEHSFIIPFYLKSYIINFEKDK